MLDWLLSRVAERRYSAPNVRFSSVRIAFLFRITCARTARVTAAAACRACCCLQRFGGMCTKPKAGTICGAPETWRCP